MSSVTTTDIALSDGTSSAGWTRVASFDSYEDAQRAVDRLSDASFPVENIEIIGRNLRFVERVTGRVTRASATAAGAGTGAWWGLFIGLLVGLFTTGSEWLGLVLGGILIGALWGASFGFVAHWATKGMRDFASTSQLVAAQHDLMVVEAQADAARSILGAGTD